MLESLFKFILTYRVSISRDAFGSGSDGSHVIHYVEATLADRIRAPLLVLLGNCKLHKVRDHLLFPVFGSVANKGRDSC